MTGFQPYVGPQPFRREDANIFFGRDREIADLKSLIVGTPAIVLFAESGAGKTSLINAGLIPALIARNWDILPVVRFNREATGEVAGNPFVGDTLRALANDENAVPPESKLVDFFRQLPAKHNAIGDAIPRLLIFDQFEEFFRVHPQYWVLRHAFFQQIVDLLSDPECAVHILFAMREEYLAQFDHHTTALARRFLSRYRLELLARNAALSAITGPLPEDYAFEKGAAEILVDDLLTIRVEAEGVDQPVETPGQFVEPVQLQVVCKGLWSALPPGEKTITLEQVKKQDTGDKALEQFYADAIASASSEHAIRIELRRWCESDLVTASGTRAIAHHSTADKRGIPPEALQALNGLHVVRVESRNGADWYELSHDRLINPILTSNASWFVTGLSDFQSRARIWNDRKQIDQNLLTSSQLQDAKSWLAGYGGTLLDYEQAFLEKSRHREVETERRDRTRMRIAAAGALTIILLVGLLVFALYQWKVAKTQRSVAQIERIADDAANSSRHGDDDLAMLLSVEAIERYDSGANDKTSAELAALAAMNDSFSRYPSFHGAFPLTSTIRSIAFDPLTNILAVGGDDGQVHWLNTTNIATDAKAPLLPEGSLKVWSIAYSPDGLHIAIGGCSKTEATVCTKGYVLIGVRTGASEEFVFSGSQLAYPFQHAVRSVAFDQTGRFLAVAIQNGVEGIAGKVLIWAIDGPPDSEPNVIQLPGINLWSPAIAFHPLTNDLFIGYITLSDIKESGVLQYSLTDLTHPLADYAGGVGGARAIAFSPDGSRLVAAINVVWWWDIYSGPVDSTPVASPVASVTDIPALRVQGQRFGDRDITVTSVVYIDDHRVIAGNWTNTLEVVAFGADGVTVRAVPVPSNVLAIGRNSDGRIAIAREDGGVQYTGMKPVNSVPGIVLMSNEMWAVAFDPNGEIIYSGGRSGQLSQTTVDGSIVETTLFPTAPSSGSATEQQPAQQIWSVAINGSGSLLAAGEFSRVEVWRRSEDQWQAPIVLDLPSTRVASNPIRALGFRPGSETELVTTSWDGTVAVWDLSQSQPTPVILNPGDTEVGSIRGLVFTDDGQYAITSGCTDTPQIATICSKNGMLAVWNLEDRGQPATELYQSDGPRHSFYSVAITNGWLAAGTLNGDILLWELSTRREPVIERDHPATVHGQQNSIRGLIFRKDGGTLQLISVSDDGTGRIWWNFDHGNSFTAEIVRESLPIRGMALNADNTVLAFAGVDKTVRFWTFEFEQTVATVCDRVWRNLTEDEWRQYIDSHPPSTPRCSNLNQDGSLTVSGASTPTP